MSLWCIYMLLYPKHSLPWSCARASVCCDALVQFVIQLETVTLLVLQTLNLSGSSFTGGIPAAWRRWNADGTITGMTSLTDL